MMTTANQNLPFSDNPPNNSRNPLHIRDLLIV